MSLLCQGLAAMGTALPEGGEGRLEAFIDLLTKWNRTFNLTAIRQREAMVSHHLLDSLAVLPHLAGVESLADVGSGAGIPAIPLAIARPALRVASIEANQKKASFQRQVKIELALANLEVLAERAEEVNRRFSVVISRAFASLADFVRHAGHLSDRLLAMKGVFPETEIARLPPGWRLATAERLAVPGLDAERHLIILEKF